LSNSFSLLGRCGKDQKNFGRVAHFRCKNEMDLLRTHNAEEGANALLSIRPNLQERGHCSILTAIRDPRTWIPSMFMQHNLGGRNLCRNKNVSQEFFFEKYNEFIMNHTKAIQKTLIDALPPLLEHFGVTSLEEEFAKMNANGGYALHRNADPLGPFSKCKLLFLRMEDSENWQGALERIMPDIRYNKNKGRSEVCPAIAHHYKALQNYEYSVEERKKLIGKDKNIKSYFGVYGNLGEKSSMVATTDGVPAPTTESSGPVVVIVNTPKTGTGGLTNTFARSFKCGGAEKAFDQVSHYSCQSGVDLLRTHNPEPASEALATIRPNFQDREQCLVITAIRDPRTWIPSMFMQSALGGRDLCNAKIDQKGFFQRYHDFIMGEYEFIQHGILHIRPPLLKHFGATSLDDEFAKMEKNGGYSLLDKPDPLGPFSNCELLFLRMEDSAKWPSFISTVMPGVKYQKNKSRSQECPRIADHYKALQYYDYSDEEIIMMTGGNPEIASYFNIYGF